MNISDIETNIVNIKNSNIEDKKFLVKTLILDNLVVLLEKYKSCINISDYDYITNTDSKLLDDDFSFNGKHLSNLLATSYELDTCYYNVLFHYYYNNKSFDNLIILRHTVYSLHSKCYYIVATME